MARLALRLAVLAIAASLAPPSASAQSSTALRVRLRGIGPFHFKLRKQRGRSQTRTVRLVEWTPTSGGRERHPLTETQVTVVKDRAKVHLAPGNPGTGFEGLFVHVDSLSNGAARVSLFDPSRPDDRPEVQVSPEEDIVQIEPGYRGYALRALPASTNATPEDPPGSLPQRIYDLELPVPG